MVEATGMTRLQAEVASGRARMAKARDMGMTLMRHETMKNSQPAPQATYQGLPLIGQKAAVDSKQQFITELNRRFQAVEACCNELQKARIEHSRALGLLALELKKVRASRNVVRRPKKASDVHPGVRGRGR